MTCIIGYVDKEKNIWMGWRFGRLYDIQYLGKKR